MSFKTALYLAFISLTFIFYISGTVTNVATKLAHTVSLWEVCTSGNCTSSYSVSCSEGNQVLNADRAFSIISCSLAGICLILGVIDFIWPNKLFRWTLPLTAAISTLCGVIAFSLGFAIYSTTLCTGTASLENSDHDIGPHAILLLFGTCFNVGAIAMACCGPETDTEIEEREMTKKKEKRRNMAPPPTVVPRSGSAAGGVPKKNKKNTTRSGSVSSLPPLPPPPAPSSSSGIKKRPTSPPRSPNARSPRNQSSPMNLSRSSSVGGGSFQRQQQQQQTAARPIVVVRSSNNNEPQNVQPQQSQQTQNQMMDGDWILDENSGLYWSNEQQLWYDDVSGFFIDPVTGQSYDPNTGEWSG